MSGIYGTFLESAYIEEFGLFNKKKERLDDARKYYKFIQDFLNNKEDLGYNDAETTGTLLAAKFLNISNEKILEVFAKDKNPQIKKYTVSRYFGDFEAEDMIDYLEKANISLSEYISIIFAGDTIPYVFFRYKDKKFYTMKSYGATGGPVKKCSVYEYYTEKSIKELEKIYFSKEELEAIK